MARKHLIRYSGDIRDFPRYSISEAAFYIHVPATTLAAWIVGQDYKTSAGAHRIFLPLIEPADPKNNLLSFYNLVEGHILRATREKGVPLKNLRKAIEYIRETIPGRHPLLTHDFEVSGKDVFIQHLGLTICATKHGQIAMRKILEKYLRRVVRDKNNLPIQVFPINTRRLAIHALVSSGKPVVRGTGIVASVLWGRQRTGEDVSEIAADYGLGEREVKEAIEDYQWKVAA